MGQVTPQHFVIVCGCGKKYQVSVRFAGKKAKCKVCGQVLNIPSRLLSPNVRQSQRQSTTGDNGVLLKSSCPSCGQSLSPEQVICTKCGYDTHSGKKLKMLTEESSSNGSPECKLARFPTRQFLCGIFIFGLSWSGVIWFFCYFLPSVDPDFTAKDRVLIAVFFIGVFIWLMTGTWGGLHARTKGAATGCPHCAGKSIVLPSRRERKDYGFGLHILLLKCQSCQQMWEAEVPTWLIVSHGLPVAIAVLWLVVDYFAEKWYLPWKVTFVVLIAGGIIIMRAWKKMRGE